MKFGEWLPDQPAFGHDGLVMARNVFPSPLGYGPVKDYSAVTTALPTTWRGGRAFAGVDGTVALLAGLDGGLYSYAASTWTQEVAGSYAGAWQFAQFGDLAICCQGSAPLKYTIASGAGATLGGSPPNARYVTTVKDFVVMSGVDSANSTVYWSAINNAEGWTPGTGQSDTQVLPDGGAVAGVAGGEYMLVFQREQIWRGQYVGVPLIFQFDKVSQGIGCIAPGSICQAGRTVFFYSSRGFCSFTDGEIKLIGANKVDATFSGIYSLAEIKNNVTCSVDPVRKLAVWAMPGRLWVYNWELDRWADIAGEFFGVSVGATESFTLEQIAALYPSIEDVPTSFDDPIWEGGESFLMIAANDDTLGSFGSTTTLEAILQFPSLEIIKGRDVRIRAARIDTDAADGVTLRIDARRSLGGAETAYQGTSVRTNGDMPIRASGRYIQPKATIASGTTWTYAQGIDLVQASQGGRW